MMRMGFVLLLVLGAVGVASAGEACFGFFESGSGPSSTALGMWPDGSHYGAGQSFTLNCGARLESVAFKIGRGTPVGEVPSLAYGDSVNLSILTPVSVELLRRGTMIDTGSGNRVITHYFTGQDVLLPAATYIAAVWTDASAWRNQLLQQRRGGRQQLPVDLGPGLHDLGRGQRRAVSHHRPGFGCHAGRRGAVGCAEGTLPVKFGLWFGRQQARTGAQGEDDEVGGPRPSGKVRGLGILARNDAASRMRLL